MQKVSSAGLLALLATGCGGGSSPSVGTDMSVYVPPVGSSFHWQLQGAVNTGYDVDIYDIDLEDSSASLIRDLQAQGRKVICYFSAGSYEEWRSDAGDFPASVLGAELDGWAGERWLDIRADSVRDIMESRLNLAESKGCDGVEPDNVDGYQNISGFTLTADDQLSYNRFLAEAAHERGLSIGLKNDLDQISELVSVFDFAVNEECWEYDECDALAPFIESGKAVLHVEYTESLATDSVARQAFCEELSDTGLSSAVLPLELDGSYAYNCF